MTSPKTDEDVIRAHNPNRLMDLCHAIIVKENPQTQGTYFAEMALQVIERWDAWEPATEKGQEFRAEMAGVMLSYSRAVSNAFKRATDQRALENLTFDQGMKQMSSIKVRVYSRLLMWSFKLLLVAGFGAVAAIVLGKAYVPHQMTSLTGEALPTILASITCVLLWLIGTSLWSNYRWVSTGQRYRTAIDFIEEELERARIIAFDKHWFRFCSIYNEHTGSNYSTEPMYINIMRGEVRARRQWNVHRTQLALRNARMIVEFFVRRSRRKRAVMTAIQ